MVVLFLLLNVLINQGVLGSSIVLVKAANFMLYASVPYLLNQLWSYYLENGLKHKGLSKNKKTIGFFGSILVAMLGVFAVRVFLQMGLQKLSWEQFIQGENLAFYGASLSIAIIAVLFFHLFYWYKAVQEKKVAQQKIIASTASAQFDALKNQLDPHFLFNSLNVLTSLIEENTEKAQNFTTSLSKIYRYVLEQKNKNLVPVDEELAFARTYIKLLKMRFENSIVLEIIDKCSNPDAKIVPLSLQLLLENAVKHNIVNETKPLHIRVFEDKGKLVVNNNIQAKPIFVESSGVGLQNIMQRYRILTDRPVEITPTSTEFQVRLPMLTERITEPVNQESYLWEKRYQKAKERVEDLKGFYVNLASYVLVIPILWYLNWRTTSFPWAIFPTLGWGFGVLTHGMEAYGYNPLWGKRWEQKKIKKLMDKEDF